VSVPAILLPLFVQVALIFGLGILLGARRLAAVRSGELRGVKLKMGERNWPAPAQQASNAFSNQFELPVLFLVLVPLAILTRKADLLFVMMSWIFVVTRFAHAAAYVTTNRLAYRFGAYVAGALVLLAMWAIFAVRILIGPWPA
jgi:hypothetical protein